MGENYDKTISILAYIPIVGWIIALVLNSDKPSAEKSYNAYHLRQALGLVLLYIFYTLLNWLVTWIPFIGSFIDSLVKFIFLGFSILGALNALRGNKKPLPVFGERVNRLMAGAFD